MVGVVCIYNNNIYMHNYNYVQNIIIIIMSNYTYALYSFTLGNSSYSLDTAQ